VTFYSEITFIVFKKHHIELIAFVSILNFSLKFLPLGNIQMKNTWALYFDQERAFGF
jgi:hypothetical protein